MPTYTLRRKSTDEHWNVIVSYDELQEMLKDEDVERVLSTAAFVTMVGGTLSRTSSDFKDHLKKIDKANPRNNMKL